jgi:hypothetical protein
MAGVLMLACGGDANENCPAFSSGTQTPIEVETAVTRLPGGANIPALIVDDSALYWYDETTAIWRLPRGATQPVELRPAPMQPVTSDTQPSSELMIFVNGFASDADFLYWGLAYRYVGFDAGFVSGFSPPGALLTISKSGLSPTTLAEFPDRTIAPLAAAEGRVIVRMDGPAAGIYSFEVAGARLQPLPSSAPTETTRVIDGSLYWTEQVQANPRLMRASVDDTEPEVVANLENGDFEVGPGYVLWRQERTHIEPELVLEQNFVKQDEATGCIQPLPGTGETISFTTALDAQHVYWHSYNGLGSISNPTPADGEAQPNAPRPRLPIQPMIRVNLQTGTLQRLRTPGFAAELGDQIVGQDSEHVYVTTNSGLVAVKKP